jgi:hypothetical protein
MALSRLIDQLVSRGFLRAGDIRTNSVAHHERTRLAPSPLQHRANRSGSVCPTPRTEHPSPGAAWEEWNTIQTTPLLEIDEKLLTAYPMVAALLVELRRRERARRRWELSA